MTFFISLFGAINNPLLKMRPRHVYNYNLQSIVSSIIHIYTTRLYTNMKPRAAALKQAAHAQCARATFRVIIISACVAHAPPAMSVLLIWKVLPQHIPPR